MIINLFLINKFLFFCAMEFECSCLILLKNTILRSRVQYGQYCTLLDQSDCRYFIRKR